MELMRSFVMGLVFAAALAPRTASSQPVPGSTVPAITIRLSNFAFTPEQVTLRTGSPVRLHLVNDSSGGHNFSAPAFFAASASLSVTAPPGGVIDVAAGGSADIVVTPRVPGIYKFECTHFLHSLFGMTGRIIVQGPSS